MEPSRGEVWSIDLNPTIGRERAGTRPALIVSVNELNSSPRDLVIIVPVTGTVRGIPTHVLVEPPAGGLTKPSVIMTEQVRAVSKARLRSRLGVIPAPTMV